MALAASSSSRANISFAAPIGGACGGGSSSNSSLTETALAGMIYAIEQRRLTRQRAFCRPLPPHLFPPPCLGLILIGSLSSAPSLDSSMEIYHPQQEAAPPAAATGGPPLVGYKRYLLRVGFDWPTATKKQSCHKGGNG